MTVNILGRISLYDMMIYFFIYGFLGWIAEVIYATLKTGKFINRGFLNGPICPIYGVGMAVCVLLLNLLEHQWWLLFLVGGALATVLEFITGLVLDKAFKTKWWDYSKEHFNVKGYVCLKFSLLWGLAVLLLFKTLVPLTDKLIAVIPFKWWGLSILSVLWIILISDIIVVVIQLKRLKNHINEIGKLGEFYHKNSDIIGYGISSVTLIVSEKLKIVGDKIKKSRLGKAFPTLLNRHKELDDEINSSTANNDGFTDKDNSNVDTKK